MSEHRDGLTTSDIVNRTSQQGAGQQSIGQQGTSQQGSRHEPLFSDADSGRMRTEWDAVQAAFVDDPRAAVERADGLVANTIQSLATTFSNERSQLEGQWGRGEDVSTEDLRVALQRYRSFFDRLLSI